MSEWRAFFKETSEAGECCATLALEVLIILGGGCKFDTAGLKTTEIKAINALSFKVMQKISLQNFGSMLFQIEMIVNFV